MQPNSLFHSSRWGHTRSLYWLAVSSVVAALVLVPFWILDDRTLGGVSVWEKPLKFFISSAIFALTYSWLSSFITRGQRWVQRVGNIMAFSMVVELVLITAVAATGETSHFNVSSPFAITIWSLMAVFISIVLVTTVLLSILIIRDKGQEFTLRLGLGLGSLNTAVGMALAFLMTSPTAEQLANFEGIAGAHSVGTSDGGPGLPLLGWSTVAGDLRVGHFFGLHSIQVAAIVLALALILPLATRIPLLIVGNAAYLGFVVLVTWQALRAEPFLEPSELTLSGAAVLATAAIVSFAILAFMGSRPKQKQSA